MKYFSLLVLLLLLPRVIAEPIVNEDVKLKDLYCTEEGKIGFKLSPVKDFGTAEIMGVLVKQADSSEFTAIEGSWDRDTLVWDETNFFRDARFTSLEAEIRNSGTHELKVSYKLKGEVKDIDVLFDCEGTKFSCRLFDIGVESCGSSDGIFTAVFRTKGLTNDRYEEVPEYSVDDLNFLLVTDSRYCDKEGGCGKSAGIPESATLEDIGEDRLKLTWEYESNVKGVSISLEPAKSCERKDLDYEFSTSEYLSCDPDPFVKKFECRGCELGSVCVLEGDSIIVEGIDVQQVGEVAANIRAWRKPEPFKGKGIKYKDEYIFRKEGKKK